MQEFFTREVRHEFKIDGHMYWLPGCTVGDLEAIAELADLEDTQQLVQFRDLMVDRSYPKRRTLAQWLARVPTSRAAIRSLTIAQLSALFVAWSGFGGKTSPGESSALPDSVPDTDKN